MQKLERVSKKRILKYKCFASIVIASKHSTIRLRTKRVFFLRQLVFSKLNVDLQSNMETYQIVYTVVKLMCNTELFFHFYLELCFA